MAAPYSNAPPAAFWKSAVAEASTPASADIYQPKFQITQDTKVATAGSCFAQHLARGLRQHGAALQDFEPLGAPIATSAAQAFGYGVYSGRYGNIYTTRQLHQLLQEMQGNLFPAVPVWEKDGRFFDAQRPTVEPNGLGSADLVAEARQSHLVALAEGLAETQVFVFTLGLTECWLHSETGTVYPTAPGTIAGSFDPNLYHFHNMSMAEVVEEFLAAKAILQSLNPTMRFLLTVSPVPLTATATDQHVLVASTQSKAILRAAAAELASHDDTDYFPSFEIVTHPKFLPENFASNLRTPAPEAVAQVLACFFDAHGFAVQPDAADDYDDAACEEALLNAFAPDAAR